VASTVIGPLGRRVELLFGALLALASKRDGGEWHGRYVSFVRDGTEAELEAKDEADGEDEAKTRPSSGESPEKPPPESSAEHPVSPRGRERGGNRGDGDGEGGRGCLDYSPSAHASLYGALAASGDTFLLAALEAADDARAAEAWGGGGWREVVTATRRYGWVGRCLRSDRSRHAHCNAGTLFILNQRNGVVFRQYLHSKS